MTSESRRDDRAKTALRWAPPQAVEAGIPSAWALAQNPFPLKWVSVWESTRPEIKCWKIGLVGAVAIELVGQSLSLAESTALTPLQPSKTPLEQRILATSWPQRDPLDLLTKFTGASSACGLTVSVYHLAPLSGPESVYNIR